MMEHGLQVLQIILDGATLELSSSVVGKMQQKTWNAGVSSTPVLSVDVGIQLLLQHLGMG